jgi:ProP effector
MGPHPRSKPRPIITLKGAIARAPSTSDQRPANGLGKPADGGRLHSPPSPSVSTSSASATAPQFAASQARRVARDVALDWLGREYPLAFGADVKPLAIGIGKQLWDQAKAAGIGREAFNAARSKRTTSLSYLKALATDGAQRHDLDGNPVEAVAIEHQVHAFERAQAKLEVSKRSTGNGA